MKEIIIASSIALFVGFVIGYFVCAVMSTAKCQECRLKEIKEFEDDSD